MTIENQSSGTIEPKQPRIVVGVDGSPASLEALDWAVREARLRGATLEVVHASFFRQAFLDSFPGAKEGEQSILDAALARAKAMAPDIRLVGRFGDPPAAEVLVEVSKDADLLVVGSRGLGPFKEFALGSVSHDCARHAQCPLVIVGSSTAHTQRSPMAPGDHQSVAGPIDRRVAEAEV
jgi:nucleotide-binding universal stress UspA family protein